MQEEFCRAVAKQQCVLTKGNLLVKHHNVTKDLWITLTTALVPLGMFPEKRYALANSPCTRAAYSLVCNCKWNTGTQCKQMASLHTYPWNRTVNGPNLVLQSICRGLVVLRKVGQTILSLVSTINNSAHSITRRSSTSASEVIHTSFCSHLHTQRLCFYMPLGRGDV